MVPRTSYTKVEREKLPPFSAHMATSPDDFSDPLGGLLGDSGTPGAPPAAQLPETGVPEEGPENASSDNPGEGGLAGDEELPAEGKNELTGEELLAEDEELLADEADLFDEEGLLLEADDPAVVDHFEETVEKLASEPKRQFDAVRDIAIDVAGLVSADHPELAAAGRLSILAAEMGAGIHAVPEHQHGTALAEMFALLTSLFRLGHQIEADPRRYCQAEDSPLASYAILLPQLRSCLKFVADEIGDFARSLVQSEAGVQQILAADLADPTDVPTQIARDYEMALKMDKELRSAARGHVWHAQYAQTRHVDVGRGGNAGLRRRANRPRAEDEGEPPGPEGEDPDHEGEDPDHEDGGDSDREKGGDFDERGYSGDGTSPRSEGATSELESARAI